MRYKVIESKYISQEEGKVRLIEIQQKWEILCSFHCFFFLFLLFFLEFYFSQVYWDVIVSSSFLILIIWVLSLFFLVSLGKGFSILFIKKKTGLSFINLFYYLFSHCLIFFHSDLCFFFLPSNFGLVYSSFSSSLKCKFSLLIWGLPFFLM